MVLQMNDLANRGSGAACPVLCVSTIRLNDQALAVEGGGGDHPLSYWGLEKDAQTLISSL